PKIKLTQFCYFCLRRSNLRTHMMTENDKEMSGQDETRQAAAWTESDNRHADQDQAAAPKEEKQEQEEHVVDFHEFSKKQLLDEMKQLYAKGDFKSDAVVQELKSVYDENYEKEKDEAYNNFVKEGSSGDDFEYRKSEQDREFFKLYNDFKEKRASL